MTKFTKEQLQQIAETDHVQCGDAAAMARQLLGSMEQEPVAWMTTRDIDGTFPRLHIKEDEADRWVSVCNVAPPITKHALYAAPQLPQPAVPETVPESLKDKLLTICDLVEDNDEYCQDIWNACRAAMLHGAEPVRPTNKLRDGWVAVPVEPTAAMYEAGDQQLATKQVWDAMIAAAPQQEAK